MGVVYHIRLLPVNVDAKKKNAQLLRTSQMKTHRRFISVPQPDHS